MVEGSGVSRLERASSDIQTNKETNLYGAGRYMGRSYILPGEALMLWYWKLSEGTIKLTRRGEPEAGKEKRVADFQVVLKTHGL